MKRLALELRVGLFVVVAVVLILFFAIFKGQLNLHRGGYEIKVAFNYVAGVDRGSPVRLSGVRVGEVKKVEIDYTTGPKVYLTLALDKGVKLGRHSQVFIRSFGLIGEKYVEILPSPLTDTPLIQPNEILTGTEPLPLDKLLALGEDLGRSLQRIVTSLDRVLGDPNFKKEVFATLDQMKRLSEQGNETLVKIEEAAEQLKVAATKAEKLLVSADTLVEQSRPALVQSLVNFQLASAALSIAAKNMSEVMAKVQSGENTLGALLSSSDLYSKMEDTLAELERAAAQFAEASKNLETISADIRSGKGSVGKFLTSDELYNEIKGFVSEIRAKPWRLFRPGS